jgi:glucose/arabinose dehydrogenase
MKDGSIPADNPFLNTDGALPTIYSYGHRNPQGLSIHPETCEVYDTEHGPMGGDELNHVKAGYNYGWPKITYGRNYDGATISEYTEMDGMEQPVIYWVPSIAVFDNDFYLGDMFPSWENDLLVSSLKYRELRRLTIDGDKVTGQETLVKGIGRMRSVKVAPDGSVYVLFNEPSLIVRFSRN